MRRLTSIFLGLSLALSSTACVPATPSPEPTLGASLGTLQVSTPTEPGWTSSGVEGDTCDNDYMPSDEGTTWAFAGNSSATGAYTRTDTIVSSGDDGFTVETQLTKVTYTQEFACTDEGLVNMEPNQSDIAVMLRGPSGGVSVQRVSNSGVTFPMEIQAGDSWQQVFEWQATGPDSSGHGTFTYDFTAVGIEKVSVPAGTFDALRIDAVVQMDIGFNPTVSGTYVTTIWLVQDIGLVKSEGTSQIPGVKFTDSLELVAFDSGS